jgi:hypothetical protein
MAKHSKRKESATGFSQAEWQALVDTGTDLLRLLDASIEGADRMMRTSTQSTWLNAEDLVNYGWVLEQRFEDGLVLHSLEHALHDLGLSEERDNWQPVFAVQKQDWVQDGATQLVRELLVVLGI